MSEHDSGNDPINELSRFSDGFNPTGGGMPLPAAAVRRRGDQIRRRRTALVAGASALAVAAVAVPIFAVVGGNPKSDDRNNDIADDGSGGLTVANLITDDDTVYSDGADWFRTTAGEGDGPDVFNPCAQQSLTGTGATSVVHADFELRNTDDPTAAITGDLLTQVVGDYADEAAATAAYEEISGWVETCEQRSADITEYRFLAARDIPVDGATAQVLDSHYGPVPKEIDEFGDLAHIMETGVLRQGDKLIVLTSVIVGADYNFLDEEGGTPVKRMLPAAAERLQGGGEAPSAPITTEPPASNSAVGPAIADDFPLAAGWPAADGGEVSLEGPSRTLTPFVLSACDQVIDDTPSPQDRLIAQWSQPEDFRSRQLSTYRTEDEAAAVLDGIVEAYRACPEQEPDQSGFTAHHAVTDADLGDESWTIVTTSTLNGSPAVGLQVLYVVRTGPAVLLITASNEGGASTDPDGDVTRTADSMAQEARSVIDRLCAFTQEGC